MKNIFVATLLVLLAHITQAQKTIWSYAIGNWRDGPLVYISPVIETTEAFTTPQLIERLKGEHEEFKVIMDIDVLRFATIEEAAEDRATLRAKYLRRPMEVRMLDATLPRVPRIEED